MATKARQQYFADEISLQKDSREFSLEDNIKQKIDSVEVWAQVNTIETVKVNGTALTPDANKAVNVEVPDVIDNLYTIAADDALSAKQWKILYDYIQNLQTIGRFLSNWDAATWLPITNPSESPYQYKAWDYYRVSNVAVSPASNYKPDGSSYTIWVASTTVETLSVAVSDLYLYDGTDWILLSNSWGSIAVDSSLSTISTNPVENRVITNALNWKHPWAISNVAPSTPVEWMLWYDTTNDELKTYDWTAWVTEWTKMVVLEYGVSTWQNFIDAYNENAIVYCKVSSWSSGYRMAFMAYTAWQWTPTEVEFQYYRSRSSHSQSSTQLDEVYVYKLTNAWVWTTTQRDTWAKMIAGTWIWITFNSSGATINNTWVTSVNWNTGTVTVEEVPSWWTEWQVLTQTNSWPTWQNPTGWAEIEYKTQAEYDALPSSKLTDGKHYFIYSTSWWWGWRTPWVNTLAYYPLNSTYTVYDQSGNWYDLTDTNVTFGSDGALFQWNWYLYSSALSTDIIWSTFTISAYVKKTTATSDMWISSNVTWLYYWYILTLWWNQWQPRIEIMNSNWSNVSSGVDTATDTWYNVVVTHDTWWHTDIYVDWVYKASMIKSIGTQVSWQFTIWAIKFATSLPENYFNWYISNFIIEDVAWSAQDVADYYDATKWDYWIS